MSFDDFDTTRLAEDRALPTGGSWSDASVRDFALTMLSADPAAWGVDLVTLQVPVHDEPLGKR